jgi:hypothetical protein
MFWVSAERKKEFTKRLNSDMKLYMYHILYVKNKAPQYIRSRFIALNTFSIKIKHGCENADFRFEALLLGMALVNVPASERSYRHKNQHKGIRWMKNPVKTQDEQTMWYENDAPVQEYLDSEFSKKFTVAEKDQKNLGFSWLEIMQKSFYKK